MSQKGYAFPSINKNDGFPELLEKLARVFTDSVDKPITFDEFRTSHNHILTAFLKYLHTEVHHPALVAAILALKGHFVALETDDDQGIHAARGFACEALALRFVTHLADREVIDSLLYELPEPTNAHIDVRPSATGEVATVVASEQSPLLPRDEHPAYPSSGSYDGSSEEPASQDNIDLALQFQGLNALEIAAVSGAKNFLSQRPVQRIINAIWKGDIIFWANLRSDGVKHAQIYQRKATDPYCRLRVPIYLKTFEVLFFIAFLVFYYIVLVQRSFYSVTAAEILLYVWMVSFAHNEIGEFWDAGVTFYLSDFWSAWDIGIIAIGAAFFITRMIGLARGSDQIIDTSFDILSLEALFLVPRICSLLSLHPYFGTLIPCLTAMTKDFIKFLSLVVILYLGFLTTFCLLARGNFTFRQMSLILTKVFFGSSYLGFDIAEKISPYLGLPLMLIFVCLTNILLITSLISILSNSLTKVIEHARDEYLFVYSVFVLEAATSNRLTYFLPPLNLIPLAFRPLRLLLSAEQLRSTRIVLLKISHLPHVLAIGLYERLRQSVQKQPRNELGMGSPRGTERPTAWRRSVLSHRMSTPYPLIPAKLGRTDSQNDGAASQSSIKQHKHNDKISHQDIKSTLDQLTTQIDQLRQLLDHGGHHATKD